MFWKAFGLAALVLVALGGLAGTATFAALYFTKDSGISRADADEQARAEFERGKESSYECDTIVGARPKSLAGRKAGEKIGLTLQVRSTRTGNVYEVDTPPACTVNSNLDQCQPDSGYGAGKKYPLTCQ